MAFLAAAEADNPVITSQMLYVEYLIQFLLGNLVFLAEGALMTLLTAVVASRLFHVFGYSALGALSDL